MASIMTVIGPDLRYYDLLTLLLLCACQPSASARIARCTPHNSHHIWYTSTLARRRLFCGLLLGLETLWFDAVFGFIYPPELLGTGQIEPN